MTNVYLTDSDEEAIVDFCEGPRRVIRQDYLTFKGQIKEGVSLGGVCEESQAVCQCVQDLV